MRVRPALRRRSSSVSAVPSDFDFDHAIKQEDDLNPGLLPGEDRRTGHDTFADLGFGREITAGHAADLLQRIYPEGPADPARCEFAAEFLADMRRLDAQIRDTRVRADRRQVRGSLPWPRRAPLAGPGRPVPDVTRVWAFGQQWSRRVTR